MTNLEKLIRDHAYWADKVRALKQLGCDASGRCHRQQADPVSFPGPALRDSEPNCIEAVFFECQEINRENAPERYSFEEVWDEAVSEGNVCLPCQSVRRYRAERMEASRRLGNVRAAITRVGRRLAANEDANED